MEAPASPIVSVLIAEDSGVQRAHLALLLRELGVRQVHEAANGVEALTLLDSLAHTPDVMIIDLEMPVMDGVELIQHLQMRSVSIPFVVASTRESPLIAAVLEMARGHGLRAARAAQKPLTLDSLRDALEQCMRLPSGAPAQRGGLVEPDRLAKAIRSGVVRPHYQPKVDIRSGLIRGAEVLARWTDPVLGPVGPDRFIPVAEAQGLIHELTLSMLRQSLAQLAKWQAKGVALSIAVNLSPRLLDSSRLVGEIGALVREAGVRPEQLVLEVTESAVISCESLALGTLARLRMAGYGLAIDDYGTGFSSMQQLSRIPFTELKIDRSFVHGASVHQNLRVLLQSAIEMAARLGLTSVAEGVETMEDWALLRGYGCNLGQGWLIGRALPGPELPNWLREHQHRLAALRASDSGRAPKTLPPTPL